ncbi:lasso peptide biosynthesis B2 protein [Litchfieldella qijiaojingensis]|uniref:lasso peptide biosynthesis B2 protein n=1 Tax=Litchfieldella qijiaojingensis TaxID=980347 RepID=UPI001678BA2E|nr:lasso peptide biosynthesis B2 protein [Halomonas qijiaojingensis]
MDINTMPSFSKICCLSRIRKIILVEAAFLLPFAWLLVRAVPFRWWSRWLGTSTSGEVDPDVVTVDERSQDIAWAVLAINRHVGERFTCLMLAMAAQWMFSRRRISSSLVLGTLTERGEDKRMVMKAHAWLRVGARVVVGQHGGRYIPISSFVRTYHYPEDY